MRLSTVSLLLAVFFFNALLLAQEQAQKKATLEWVFAYAQGETLVPVGPLDGAAANRLTWAICADVVTRIAALAPTRASGGLEHSAYQYRAARNLPTGAYCLLVDSASHDGMFVWGGLEPSAARPACVAGFPEAAEQLAGRKVASCYLIGGHGAGAAEVVLYKEQSPTDHLAALVVDDFRDPFDHHYWMVKFPASDPGWSGKGNDNFHPERFRLLFTTVDDPTSNNGETSQVRLVAIERKTSEGADLTLYRPVGNQLKPVVTNHHSFRQLITRR